MSTEILPYVSLGFIGLVALLHIGFLFLEATLWASPFGRGLTHLGEEAARETVGIGKNMGLYNGFLGLAPLWVTFALDARQAYSAQWLLLSFIVLAGIVGAGTMKNKGIFLFQSLPALAALGLIWADRPYPRTEDEAIREIIKVERQILALKSVDLAGQPAGKDAAGMKPAPVVPRGQHPKMHGLVVADFVVDQAIPEPLKVGIFREPGKTYKALIRFSNARNPDDRDKGGQGMAIKLFDVPAAGEPPASIQDFILFDAPAFFVGNPIQYVEFEDATLRALGKTKVDTKLNLLASTFLNYYWRHPRHLLNLVGTQQVVKDALAIDYHSVTPYALGKSAVKYKARHGTEASPVADSEDMLREAMKAALAHHPVEFSFQVQLQGDPASMPIEDAAVRWDEDASMPITVAKITIKAGQDFDTAERRDYAEQSSFTPWHGLPEHKPLGGINHARREIYESLSEFRHDLNKGSRREPTWPPPGD